MKACHLWWLLWFCIHLLRHAGLWKCVLSLTRPANHQTLLSLRAWVSMWSLGATEFLHNSLQVVRPADISRTLATVNLCQHHMSPRWSMPLMVSARPPAREKLMSVYSKVQEEVTARVCLSVQQHPESCQRIAERAGLTSLRPLHSGWRRSCFDIEWMCYFCTTVNYSICFLSAFCNKMENVRRMKTLNYWACFYSSPCRFMTRQNSSWLLLSGRCGEHIWNHINYVFEFWYFHFIVFKMGCSLYSPTGSVVCCTWCYMKAAHADLDLVKVIL